MGGEGVGGGGFERRGELGEGAGTFSAVPECPSLLSVTCCWLYLSGPCLPLCTWR